ncbi:MAG: hypothetical protein K8S87_05630 [Planctomycetes bacterium]|nr:hypothetical protein [Planctomycetota bacterium]
MKKSLLLLIIIIALLGCSTTPPKESPTEAFQDYLDSGKFYLEHQQFSEALKYFRAALIEAQTVDNLYGQAVALLSLSQVMQSTVDGNSKGNESENLAVLYFNQASEIIPLISKEQPDVSQYYLNLIYGQYYEILAYFDIMKGDKPKALENLKTAEKYYENSIQ